MSDERCPNCLDVLIAEREMYGPGWLAMCLNCADYDVSLGRGASPEDAKADYADMHENGGGT